MRRTAAAWAEGDVDAGGTVIGEVLLFGSILAAPVCMSRRLRVACWNSEGIPPGFSCCSNINWE